MIEVPAIDDMVFVFPDRGWRDEVVHKLKVAGFNCFATRTVAQSWRVTVQETESERRAAVEQLIRQGPHVRLQ